MQSVPIGAKCDEATVFDGDNSLLPSVSVEVTSPLAIVDPVNQVGYPT